MENLNLVSQLSYCPRVICVVESQVTAVRQADSMIASGAGACVGLKKIGDLRLIAKRHLSRAISGAIVNDNHLNRSISLRQHTLDRFRQVTFAILNRDNYADKVFIIHPYSLRIQVPIWS